MPEGVERTRRTLDALDAALKSVREKLRSDIGSKAAGNPPPASSYSSSSSSSSSACPAATIFVLSHSFSEPTVEKDKVFLKDVVKEAVDENVGLHFVACVEGLKEHLRGPGMTSTAKFGAKLQLVGVKAAAERARGFGGRARDHADVSCYTCSPKTYTLVAERAFKAACKMDPLDATLVFPALQDAKLPRLSVRKRDVDPGFEEKIKAVLKDGPGEHDIVAHVRLEECVALFEVGVDDASMPEAATAAAPTVPAPAAAAAATATPSAPAPKAKDLVIAAVAMVDDQFVASGRLVGNPVVLKAKPWEPHLFDEHNAPISPLEAVLRIAHVKDCPARLLAALAWNLRGPRRCILFKANFEIYATGLTAAADSSNALLPRPKRSACALYVGRVANSGSSLLVQRFAGDDEILSVTYTNTLTASIDTFYELAAARQYAEKTRTAAELTERRAARLMGLVRNELDEIRGSPSPKLQNKASRAYYACFEASARLEASRALVMRSDTELGGAIRSLVANAASRGRPRTDDAAGDAAAIIDDTVARAVGRHVDETGFYQSQDQYQRLPNDDHGIPEPPSVRAMRMAQEDFDFVSDLFDEDKPSPPRVAARKFELLQTGAGRMLAKFLQQPHG